MPNSLFQLKLNPQNDGHQIMFPNQNLSIASRYWGLNPLNAKLNSICHLLALLGAYPILHISRIRVNVKSLFLLMQAFFLHRNLWDVINQDKIKDISASIQVSGPFLWSKSPSRPRPPHSRGITHNDSSGRVISSSQRPLRNHTQHSEHTDIHAPGGIRTHNLSRPAALDRTGTGTGGPSSSIE